MTDDQRLTDEFTFVRARIILTRRSPMNEDHNVPFAVWTLFRNAPQWWLARGCPPTFGNERRALQTSVLLGATGLASGWLSALLLLVNSIIHIHEEGLFWMPGAVFGLIVLVPLSRWTGRNWFAAVFAIPVSTGAYWTAIYVYLENAPLFGSGRLDPWLAGCLGGASAMAILSVWMAPLRAGRWLAVLIPAGVSAGAVAGAISGYGLDMDGTPASPPMFDVMWQLGHMSLVFTPFQTIAAMALGLRLWWLPQSGEGVR
jgi:hypothetical protein